MRLVHRFLCWFPLWAFGTILALVGLAATAAQVWPAAKRWDEARFSEVRSVMSAPLFWFIAIIVCAAWVYLTWRTWPMRKNPQLVEGLSIPTPFLDGLRRGLRGGMEPTTQLRHGATDPRPANATRHPMIEQIIRNKYLDQDARMEAERRAKFGPPLAPTRDVSLSEGLAFATFGEWGKTFYDAVTAGLVPSNEPLMRFRQLAHDGALLAWGKRSENGIFQLIPNEHWIDHNVEWFDLLRGTARTENATHTTPDPFLEIMVSRVQFEKEWPHAG